MVDYAFYVGTYFGSSIPDDDFLPYAARAEERLKRYKRIYTVVAPEDNSEAMAVCAMADALYSFDMIANGDGGAVQSASLGSVSVSYGGASSVDISPKAQERELYRCACLYLDIYRGCG